MTRREDLLEKVRNGPRDVRFEELATLLARYGFGCRTPSGGGSHHVFFHPSLPGVVLTIPKPHGSKVKPPYVRRAIELIDDVTELEAGVYGSREDE